MDAAGAGVPVVITAARALRDYLVAGETAVVVPPGDAAALRAAVDRLMADPAERERVRGAAFEHSQAWTGEDYLAAIGALLAKP
jgi:glycosyltransferase involved in cell wall biosynthesis